MIAFLGAPYDKLSEKVYGWMNTKLALLELRSEKCDLRIALDMAGTKTQQN